MERRDFLKSAAVTAAAAASLSWSGSVLSAGGAGGKFLVVMLRGAYDAANFLAPVGSDDYHAARPNIGLAKSGDGAAISIDADWGLHPSCSAIHALYKSKQALFVPFSGNPSAPRSHFEAQDLMEAGREPGSRLDSSSGWLGRAVEVVSGKSPGIGAMSFTNNLALTLKGSVSVPNVSGGALSGRVDKGADDQMRKLYRGSDLEGLAKQGADTRERVGAEMAMSASETAVMEAASRGAKPAGKGLADQFSKIAKLMKADPMASMAFVDVGGWDTHVNQGAATGQLAGKLEALSEALAAYAKGMGPAWSSAQVLVLSEFGRTFRENGNRGTDHGHGTVAWVLGGGIRGGRLAGAQERVSMGSLNENRDLKVLNDYRGVAAESLAGLYGLGARDLDYILPKSPRLGLGLI